MKARLAARAFSAFVIGLIAVGLLIFLPAGTFAYPWGWLFCGVLFIPMMIMGTVLLLKNPALLEKRLSRKEAQSEQKTVVKLSALMFLLGFVLCGLDFRFGWFPLPKWIPFAAAVIFLLGYLMYAEVLRENAYLSRTVEVQEEQQVMLNQIMNAIAEFVQAYNVEKQYALILTTSGDILPAPVVTGSAALDITDEILAGLNAEYVKTKAAETK